MTDDETRLDARVRRALTALPAPDDVDTRTALRSVLDRSPGRGHDRPSAARRWGAPLAAAAAVAAVAAAVTVGALVTPGPDRTAPLEGPLETPTGTWERQVPPSEEAPIRGRWTMTLTPDGVLALVGPKGAPSAEGASYSNDRRQVRVDAFVNNMCGELPAGTYEWRLATGDLTLSVVDDSCRARADLLAGSWSAVP